MATGGCSVLTILRTAGRSLRTKRFTGFLIGWATFACLTLRYSTDFACFSATWTAPPPTTAQPAAQADNFARAIRTDISDCSLCYVGIFREPRRHFRPIHLMK